MALLFLTQVVLYFLGGISAFLFNRSEEAANRLTHLSATLAGLAGTFYSLAILSGEFSFPAFKIHAATLSPLLKNVIFISALIGFGAKAGMIPLRIGLPRGPSPSPSHVSAQDLKQSFTESLLPWIRFRQFNNGKVCPKSL